MALKRPEFPADEIEENGNLPKVFLHRAGIYGDRTALRYKVDGEYRGAYSWREWMRNVRHVAMGLHELGVRKGDSVGIFSENCPEWTFADLGALSLGAVTVPVYPNASQEDIRHIIGHSGLKVLFVSTEEQLQKVLPFRDALCPDGLILFFPEGVSGVNTLDHLRDCGRRYELNQGDLYEICVSNVGPDDLATILYTSGTTGAPKGVMLTHRNFIANYQGSFQRIQIDDRDSVVSFLPLSHVFERLAGFYYMSAYGLTISYAESMATVAEDIKKVRPTIVTSVPRFYEKAHARIREEVSKAPKWKQRLFDWAVRIGTRSSQIRIRRQKMPIWLSVYYRIAKALIFDKIKKAFGGRIRFFISGGAPLSKDLARFFHAAGMLVLEGYGLTETSPVIAVNAVGDCKFGTVGKPIAGVKVKIAEDGEILTSGPCVMKGYYQNPEATDGMIRDGWLYTGDIGYFDEEGFLHITDRKKDIIVTAGGKNVAPQNIEGRILADALFAQAVVIGDKRPYLCALLVPNREELVRLAAGAGFSAASYEELLKRPEVRGLVALRVAGCLEGLASYEQVKSFELFPREFTIGEGELTPTLKIKRRVVMKKYQPLIDELYRRTDAEWSGKASSKSHLRKI